MVEPFAGSAATTLAAASAKCCETFLISDALKPLAELWAEIIEQPTRLCDQYRDLWESQFKGDPIERYNEIRAAFNSDHDSAKLLFLLARCVKNAVRFNPSGQFNQSADKRRTGTHPNTMEREITAAHRLLRGRTRSLAGDFRTVLAEATPEDIVYLDPPYQVTSEGRDSRYFQSVSRQAIVELLEDLNRRHIQFVLSYDGHCGNRTYGEPLPAH
jgi:DNA adenine methylase